MSRVINTFQAPGSREEARILMAHIRQLRLISEKKEVTRSRVQRLRVRDHEASPGNPGGSLFPGLGLRFSEEEQRRYVWAVREAKLFMRMFCVRPCILRK